MIRPALIALTLTACASDTKQPTAQEIDQARADCAPHGGMVRVHIHRPRYPSEHVGDVVARCSHRVFVIRERKV